MATSARRQQIRSVETRERLILATLDEIHERGYHAATTQDIAARALVSRGALLHHFPTRAELVLAAMERLLADGIAEIRTVAARVANDSMTIEQFVEFAWTMFSGRFFYLSLEMITEARNDASLRAQMIPVVKRFHDELDTAWAGLCASSARNSREAGIILNLTLCLMRGMGVQAVLRPEPAYYRQLVEVWKRTLPLLLADLIDKSFFA